MYASYSPRQASLDGEVYDGDLKVWQASPSPSPYWDKHTSGEPTAEWRIQRIFAECIHGYVFAMAPRATFLKFKVSTPKNI
jgi:hypothetical protein